MKNKPFFILCLLMASFSVNAQTLTVVNGTDESSFAPINIGSVSTAQQIQMIYTANQLRNLENKHVTKLTFYSKSSSVSYNGAACTVKILHTTVADFGELGAAADLVETTDAMTVYSGSFSLKNGQLAFELSTPFVYHGGNLLIEVTVPKLSGYGSSTYFLGQNTTDSKYRIFNRQGSSSNRRTFQPKLTFDYKSNYTITVTSFPEAGGTIAGSTSCNIGEDATLTATANPGYRFVNWTKDGFSVFEEPVYTFRPTDDITLVANFAALPPNRYTIADGNPSVAANWTSALPVWGAKMNVDQHNQIIYHADSLKPLLMTVISKMVFYAGTDNEIWNAATGTVKLMTTTEPTFANSSPQAIDATSATQVYDGFVEVTDGQMAFTFTTPFNYTGGHLLFDIKTTSKGTAKEVTFQGLPSSSYVAHSAGIGQNILPKTMFEYAFQTYTVTTNAAPVSGGTVTGNGTYRKGTEVTLTATPSNGYTFANWTENGEEVSTDANYTFIVAGDRMLTANFAPLYTIAVAALPETGGTVTGGGIYSSGSKDTIKATANAGYEFICWTKNGIYVSENPTYEFTANENATYLACFIETNTNANTHTVANGSLYDDRAPVYGSYMSQNHRSQWIYTEASLNAVVGKELTKMTLYAHNDYRGQYIDWGGAKARISFKKTTSENLYTDFDDISDASVVYEGAIAIGYNAEMRINFTTPFTYQGGNLLINVQIIDGPYKSEATHFYGELLCNINDPFDQSCRTDAPKHVSCCDAGGIDGHVSRPFRPKATFEYQEPAAEYDITVTAYPSTGGIVGGGNTYTKGSQATVTATAKPGYTFVNWTQNGTQVSQDATYTFTVVGNRNLVANFEATTYTVDVSANPATGGRTEGGNMYRHGETVTVTAIAATGYDFEKWTENGLEVSDNASYSFTVTQNRTLIANFIPKTYTVNVTASPAAGGNVEGNNTYNHNTEATVTATANAHYSFAGWTENGVIMSTDAVYKFFVTNHTNLVGNFAIDNYTVDVSVNLSEGGRVEGGRLYDYGEMATVTAIPATGYEFINWTENNVEVSKNASYSFTATEHRTLVANFQIKTYTISVSANTTAGGSVAGSNTYNHFDTATVIATASPEYDFVNWTENGVEVNRDTAYRFMVENHRTLIANFTLKKYMIDASANPALGGSITGGGIHEHFEEITLTATANNGYDFINWTENETQVSTSAAYSFTITGHRTLVANFAPRTYAIGVSANPTTGGTVTGGNAYEQDETATVSATAKPEYNFVNWTENGIEVSKDAVYSFTVTGNRTLIANFKLKTYIVDISVAPATGGIVTGSNTYSHFDTATVSAIPNIGYNFVSWTENGTVVGTDTAYSFTVTKNRKLIANFELKTYIVGMSTNSATCGAVAGGGTHKHGTTATVIAIPGTDCNFVNWTENGAVVSTNIAYSFTVTGDRTLVANFAGGSSVLTGMSGKNDIVVYPNPVDNGNYELQIKNYEWKQGDIVELFDMAGKRVYSARPSFSIPHSPFSIDMSSYQSGTYILRIGNWTTKVLKK